MTFDLVCAGVALLFLVIGLFRGLVRQVLGVAGFIGGLVLARLLAEPLGSALAPSLGVPPVVTTVVFSIVIFFAVDFGARLLGNFLHDRLGTFTGTVDKLGGAAIGLAKGLLLVWVLGSLFGLLHRHLPKAESKVPLLAQLELGKSEVVKLALELNVLGDIEEKLDQSLEGRVKRAAKKTQKQAGDAADEARKALTR